MSKTHKKDKEGRIKRSEVYYDKLMTRWIGPDYKAMLSPDKRQKVKDLLQRPRPKAAVTLFVYSSCSINPQRDIAKFRAEAFFIAVRNGLDVVRADDSLLVKLTFNEIVELPDTSIEDVVELEHPDFLWLDIGKTKNSFVPYQIMRLIENRQEKGKRTVVSTSSATSDAFKVMYDSDKLLTFLKSLTNVDVKGYNAGN